MVRSRFKDDWSGPVLLVKITFAMTLRVELQWKDGRPGSEATPA